MFGAIVPLGQVIMKLMPRNTAWLLLLGLLFLPFQLLAQSIADRSAADRRARTLYIRGQVRTTDSEATLDMVRVTLERTMGGIIQQKFTDANGNFEFIGLAAGAYRLVASRDGYDDTTVDVELYAMPRPSVMVYMQSKAVAGRGSRESSVSARDFAIPNKARKEFDKGQQLLEKHRLEEGLARFRRAIEIYPAYDDAYSMLGVVYLDLQNFDEAKRCLLKAIEINEKQAKAYFVLGGLYNHQQLYPQAEEVLLRGMALESQSWQGHFELGKTYWATGSFAKAEEHAVRARELYDRFPSVYLLLTNIYLRKRAYPEALVAMDAFLKLEPNSPQSLEVRQLADKLRTNLAPAKKQ